MNTNINQGFQKFEIVNQQEKLDNDSFRCFTINNDSSILVGCTWTIIYIYAIKNNGQIIMTQMISDQELLINQVKFMSSGKTFITIGYGISFWTLNENNLWEIENMICLEQRIQFLIFTKDETKMIFSQEGSLKFWKKRKSYKLWKTNFNLDLKQQTTSISLSNSEKELIIGMQGLVLIARSCNSYKWHISYKISTTYSTLWTMVSFLDQDMFVTQTNKCEKLRKYEWNRWDKKLIRVNYIKLGINTDLSRENSIRFEQESQLLFHKFNKTLRIFRLNNRELDLQQSIILTNCEYSFYNSRDCKFLILRNGRGKGFTTWYR